MVLHFKKNTSLIFSFFSEHFLYIQKFFKSKSNNFLVSAINSIMFFYRNFFLRIAGFFLKKNNQSYFLTILEKIHNVEWINWIRKIAFKELKLEDKIEKCVCFLFCLRLEIQFPNNFAIK